MQSPRETEHRVFGINIHSIRIRVSYTTSHFNFVLWMNAPTCGIAIIISDNEHYLSVYIPFEHLRIPHVND